jgi:hypothetical protein
MNINVKKTFSAVSAAIALCCGTFAVSAHAQSDELWGDYNSSAPTETSLPESEAPAGWEPLEKPAANDKPAKAAKPEKSPKTAKAQKEARPKAAPVGGEDRTLNFFINTGWGFGQGGHLVGEVNTYFPGSGAGVGDNKDHYMNIGQGLKLEVGAGYMATPNLETRFSADFNFGLFAPKIERRRSEGADVVDFSYWSWAARVMLVPQFEVLELFEMYVGTGLSLNFAYSTRDSSFTDANSSFTSKTVYDMQFFKPGLGLCGLVGFILPLSEEMDFLGELQFEGKSFTLNKQVVKEYTAPNTINTPTNIIYEKDEREYTAKPLYHGSNWSIRVGLRFWFGL